ncbi:MAG: sirohydrochlorin chelatase [Vampirovibrionales bacterium]
MNLSLEHRLLVLLAHGSRDPRWRKPFETLVQQADLCDKAPRTQVALAYMEMSSPSFQEVISSAMATLPVSAVLHVKVLPLFMAMGAHLTHDVPPMCEALMAQYPGRLTIEQAPALGETPAAQQVFLQVIQGYLSNPLT